MLTRREALTIAREARDQLGGVWKARIHENLGWHATVTVPGVGIAVSVYDKKVRFFTAFIGADAHLRGGGIWVGDGPTPALALQAAARRAAGDMGAALVATVEAQRVQARAKVKGRRR
jgi:hypothetical protein